MDFIRLTSSQIYQFMFSKHLFRNKFFRKILSKGVSSPVPIMKGILNMVKEELADEQVGFLCFI